MNLPIMNLRNDEKPAPTLEAARAAYVASKFESEEASDCSPHLCTGERYHTLESNFTFPRYVRDSYSDD
jgi:hypothetical protein